MTTRDKNENSYLKAQAVEEEPDSAVAAAAVDEAERSALVEMQESALVVSVVAVPRFGRP